MPANERTPTRRPPGRRWFTLAVLAAAAAAVSVACSTGSGTQAGPGNSPVASLAGHGASPGVADQPASNSQARGDQAILDFTRCMRAHGVPLPDPVHRPGHAGLSFDVPGHDSATNAAWAACNHFIARLIQAKMAGAASQAAPSLPALTRWAQCLRDHDIGMLDPTPQGQLNLGRVSGITGDFGRYSPQFRAADRACRHLLPPGVQDNGTGP